MIDLIAEIGSVHDGSFGNAIKLIELSKEVGANAVKFQLHIAEEETTTDAPSPAFFSGEDRFTYFKRTSFSPDQWAKLRSFAKQVNIDFIVSPFSMKAVDILARIDIDTYKIASGEVTNIPLLEKIGKTGKKVILSTGMSTFAEIDDAVRALNCRNNLTIMQCTSEYPCSPMNVGINVIPYLEQRYHTKVGYSDHSDGNLAALLAVSYGAKAIEKHLTFSKKMYGSDAKYASEPIQFKELSKSLLEAELIINNKVDKDAMAKELKSMKLVFEKSIVANSNLKKGSLIKEENIGLKKPGNGLSPSKYKQLIGKILNKDINKDQKIFLEDVT